MSVTRQDLVEYLKKSPENMNFNIFSAMLDEFRATYESDEAIVNKIKNIIIDIVDSEESLSPEDDTITELVDLVAEILPSKMGITPTGTMEITNNGEYDVTDYETADVAVPQTTVESKNITANGTYTAEEGKAFSPVTVNVVDNSLRDLIEGDITSLEIPEGTTGIRDHAFHGCQRLTNVTIPSSVTSIGETAFFDCAGLTSVTIPDSVTSIGYRAFFACYSLLNISIPDSVTSIDNEAFSNTAWYDNQNDGLIYAGRVAYHYKGTMPSNTSIAIQSGTKGIASQAFYNRPELIDITIPISVTIIGEGAFRECTGLSSITIPDSVTSISNNAFSECTGLTSVTIPDSITNINDGMFYNCTGLTSIIIPNNVIRIGNNVFYGCTGLTNIIIPNSVTEIAYGAFYDCISLTDVYYTGTEEQWNSINILDDNTYLTNATIHYNYTPSN